MSDSSSAGSSSHAPPRRIACVDVNAMFVSVARSVDPDGVGKEPLLIVAGGGTRSVVTSASYEVRAFGVRAGMPLAAARRACPAAVVAPVPGKAIRAKHREMTQICARFAPEVVMTSVDEGLLDFSGTEHTVYRDEMFDHTLARLRAALLDETGLPVSLGGATSALLAKMASDRAKPSKGCMSGVLVVEPGAERAFMADADLADVPGVGPKAQVRFAKIGLVTMRDVLALTHETLVQCFGRKEGDYLYALARGSMTGGLPIPQAARSVSRMQTFDVDVTDRRALDAQLVDVVTHVASELRKEDRAARTISVTVRDSDFVTRQTARTLPHRVRTDRVIRDVARELLTQILNARQCAVRLIGITLSNFSANDESLPQMTLFEELDPTGSYNTMQTTTGRTIRLETPKDTRLMSAVDQARHKFGDHAVTPGTLADRKAPPSDSVRGPMAK